MTNLGKRYGGFALVTGSSSGIGYAIASQLAARGFNLILVARRRDRLELLASSLSEKHDIKAVVLAVDLLAPDAIDLLKRDTKHLDIGLVVLNAATITTGRFLQNELEEEEQMLKLNGIVPLRMAHYFGNRLAARGRGGLLFVSSIAAYQATPFQANYAASKAYVSSLALALHVELAGSGVDVTVLAPGPTSTEGLQSVDGFDPSKLPLKQMTPERVARVGLNALGKKALVIPGAMNQFADMLGKYVFSRTFAAKLAASVMAKTLTDR